MHDAGPVWHDGAYGLDCLKATWWLRGAGCGWVRCSLCGGSSVPVRSMDHHGADI